MADLFTDLQPVNNDLFNGLQNSQNSGVANQAGDVDKTARLAGLAISDPKQPDLVGQIQANTLEMNDFIKTVGDSEVRTRAAGEQQLAEINGLSRLMNDSQATATEPSLIPGANLAAQQALSLDIDRRAKYAMEQRAIERIQDVAAVGDDAQARMLLNNIQRGDADKVIRDMNTKQLILEREIKKASQRVEDDSIVGAAASFLLSLTGVYNPLGTVGNVDVDKGLKDWTDFVWTGRRRNTEGQTLWAMPVEDFSDYVKDHLIPKIKSSSTFLGFEDKRKEMSTLASLNRPRGVITQNTWDTLDNFGWLGPAEFSKAVSIPSLLVKNGARREATNLLAQAVLDLTREGAEVATVKSGLQATDVIDNVLPHAVNPAAQIVDVFDNTALRQSLTARGEDMKILGNDLQELGQSALASGGSIKMHIEGKQIDITDASNGFRDAKGQRWGLQALLQPTPGDNARIEITHNSTPGVASNVSLGADANIAIERQTVLTEKFEDINQIGRLTDTEKQAMFEDAAARLEKQYGAEIVKDVGFTSVKLADNTEIHRVDFTLGDYETPEQATKALKDWGMTGTIIADDSGKFFVQTSQDIAETGFYTNTLNPKATGALSRFVLNARLVGDTLLANQAQAGGNTRARILKHFATDYSDKFRALSGREREATSQVLAKGETDSRWFSREEREVLWERAFKRSPTAKEHDAYEAARELNDIDFEIRNDEVYKSKVVHGYRTVSFDRGVASQAKVNGRVVEEWTTNQTDRVFNLTDQVSYNKNTPLDAATSQRLKQEGYVLVSLDKEFELASGETVRTVLAKKSDLVVENLRRDQIGYRAGGHRIYEGKYFAKQARIGQQPDGEKFLKNPGTFIVGKTKAEVAVWTDAMETARAMFNEGKVAHELDEVLPSYMSGEEFVSNMESGVFDKDMPFRTMYDREQLPEYLNTHGYSDMRDVDESNVESYLRTNGRMYYGGKGETLKDWQGSMAPTLDPFQTINRALMNVANISSLSDYKISASERWHNTFGGYLEQQGQSPMEAMRAGTFGINTPEPIRQAAEAQRDVIKRTLGWRTEWDRQKEVYGRKLSEWVTGDDPYSTRSKAGSSITQWFDNNNPVQALRGAAFDLKLGLFNVAQFPLQIGTLVAATTLNPKYGFQGMVNIFPMLYGYMTKSGTEHMLDTLIERGVHTSAGFADPKEYKAMMKQAKSSGFFDIGGTHQLINDYGPDAVAGAFSSDGKLRQAGRFWFNEGERWNRAVAWRIAWGETREKFPELAFNNSDFRAKLAGRAEEYAFNMSEQSAAHWQKGLLSIPTQFWAYNARMAEAMLGKTFTGEQRARLAIGQFLLYGSAGIPVLPAISEKIKQHYGESPSIDSWAGFADRGILDQVVYRLTGADLLVSKRFGSGAFVSDTIKDLLGDSSYGPKSFAEVAVGATGSIGTAGFETLSDVVKYGRAESGAEDMPLTRDAILRLAMNVSTVSNLHKAYMVQKYGTLISNKGTLLANVPNADAFGVALGLSPAEQDQVSSSMGYLKNEKDAVAEAVKVYTNYRTQMATQPDRRDEIYQEINAYSRLLPDNIRVKALTTATRRTPQPVLDGLQQQVEKDKIKAAALNQVTTEEDN